MFVRPFDAVLRAVDACHDQIPQLRLALPPGSRLDNALERLLKAAQDFDEACCTRRREGD